MTSLKKCICLLLSYFSLSMATVSGQGKVITGKVTDATGNPVASASVYFKGRFGGTWTSKDGVYRTILPDKADTLICSHVNFYQQRIKIEGNSIINIELQRKGLYSTEITIAGTHKFSATELADTVVLKKQQKPKDNMIFDRVEIQAYFSRGETAFKKYLASAIVYPDSATISTVCGTVIVGFLINEDGVAQDISIIKGVNPFADQAVIHAIENMPKWMPAIQNGRRVDQYKEVEVAFDIKGVK
jgi:TonB family protein